MLNIISTTDFSPRPRRRDARPIVATLAGADTCSAEGITATSTTPVLLLCRQLLAQGVDPDRAAEIYRAGTLALRIRSIGEAAALEIGGDGVGFRPARQPDAAPPMRQTENSDLGDAGDDE